MRKTPFKFTDIVLFLTIMVFIYVAVVVPRNDSRFLTIIWTVILFFSFIGMIRDRIKSIKYDELLQVSEKQHESEMSDEEYEAYLNLKGKKLEIAIEVTLKKIFTKDLVVFRDLKIPTNNKKRTQIDLVAIINNKIVVFEAKAYATTLRGEWTDEKLKAEYPKTKIVNNPVMQNKYHIDQLSQITMPNLEYFGSVIVFGDQTKYSFKQPPFRTRISKLKDLETNIQSISKSIEDLDIDTLNEIIEELKQYSSSFTKI